MGTLRGLPCMLWVLLKGQEKFLLPHVSGASSSALALHRPHSSQSSLPAREPLGSSGLFSGSLSSCLHPTLLPPSTTSCLQTPDKTILYSVATTLVNCTNSYDVKEVIPELVQLAKFSKQHVPEEHPKVAMRTAGRGGGCPPPDHQRGGTGWCVCVGACVRIWQKMQIKCRFAGSDGKEPAIQETWV